MKNNEDTQKYLAALRSGKYKQCFNRYTGDNKNEFCAWGLARYITDLPLPYDTLEALMSDRCSIVFWNDDDRLSFPEIADKIEKELIDDSSS